MAKQNEDGVTINVTYVGGKHEKLNIDTNGMSLGDFADAMSEKINDAKTLVINMENSVKIINMDNVTSIDFMEAEDE